MPMLTIVNRLTRFIDYFVKGWDYKKWNPPYPGDGV
jgi:hypothetical protein